MTPARVEHNLFRRYVAQMEATKITDFSHFFAQHSKKGPNTFASISLIKAVMITKNITYSNYRINDSKNTINFCKSKHLNHVEVRRGAVFVMSYVFFKLEARVPADDVGKASSLISWNLIVDVQSPDGWNFQK